MDEHEGSWRNLGSISGIGGSASLEPDRVFFRAPLMIFISSCRWILRGRGRLVGRAKFYTDQKTNGEPEGHKFIVCVEWRVDVPVIPAGAQ